MQIVLLGVLSFLLIVFTKDFFNPACITSVVWFVISIAYTQIEHDLFPLSSTFFTVVLFWVYSFSFGVLLTYKRKYKICNKIHESIQIRFSKIESLIILFLLLSVFLLFIESVKTGYSIFGLVRNYQLQKSSSTISISIVSFILTFIVPFILYDLMESKSRKKIIVFILYLVIVVLSGSKSTFMSFFSMLVFLLLYRKKIKLKLIILLIVFMLVILYIITFSRDKNVYHSLTDLFFIYLFSPLTAFDQVLNKNVIPNETPFGSITFGIFYRIFNKLGLCNIPNNGLGFINVPLPTNVYTVMLTGYLDYGILGMNIFSFLYGLMWGYLYSFVRRNFLFFKLIYGSFYYVLVFQFFSDYVFPYLMVFIYPIVILLFSFFKIKFYSLRYKND